jgi:ADP-dependent NAD(P)H-hydrate dehydratase / NAD(P)H-hydrate epimerase
MKIFATSLIHQLDQYTIEHEPVASIDLMERAADALYWEFISNFPYLQPVCIFAGQGNNGGDSLALARLLLNTGYSVSVVLIHPSDLSPDCETNLKRLLEVFPNALTELKDKFAAPEITNETIIIDGLFGSGLSRPLSGIFAEAVKWINQSGCKVVAIDIPSGLQGEENQLNDKSNIVKATLTLSLQFPKLAFFFPENAAYVGNWEVIEIGIHPRAIEQTSSDLFYLEETDIAALLKKRYKFSHKGTFGHALIVAGSKGMAGASVLSSKAALRSGAGLVTVHGPECNRIIVQTAIPEAIFQSDFNSEFISNVDSIESFNAIAIGPGISTHATTVEMLGQFIKKLNKPCVFDADALNIIGQHQELLELIPENSLLTPHPKEFERLFGACNSSYERMKKAQKAAHELSVIIVLKGANTLISTPEGKLYFNSTGNSGMATAGSGDVLTGILVSLLAQGYLPEEAAKVGIFLHGRAGDLALENESKESLIAGDIIEQLGKAYESIRK